MKDSQLHDVLTELECKIIAASPFPEKTRPFLLTDKQGNPQIRLKCGYVKAWKNKDKKMVSKNEALSGDNMTMSFWRIEMNKFQRAFNGSWSVMWTLHGAVVEPTQAEEKIETEDDESWIDDM